MSASAPQRMPDDGEVTVRDCQPADEPRVLELLHAAFGHWPRDVEGVRPAEFFRWKHHKSPFGASILLVAEVQGELAGFLALMPWRLCIDGEVRLSFRGVDLAVDPALHRRGVSMKLIAAARGRYSDEVALGWSNPNEYSRGGAVKSGRQQVSVPRFVGLGGARWRTVKRLTSQRDVAPAHLTRGGQSAGLLLADQALLARLLTRSTQRDGLIATAMDADFLRWRYGWSETYRGLVAEAGGRAAMAIFRVQRHGRFSVVYICELLVERDDPRLVRRLVRGVRRAAAADFVAVALRSRRLAARCGLLRSPHGAIITVNPLVADLVPDPTRSASWALSLGDLKSI